MVAPIAIAAIVAGSIAVGAFVAQPILHSNSARGPAYQVNLGGGLTPANSPDRFSIVNNGY